MNMLNKLMLLLLMISFRVGLIRSAYLDEKKTAEDDVVKTSKFLDEYLPDVITNIVIDYTKYSKKATEYLFNSIINKNLNDVKHAIDEGADVNAKLEIINFDSKKIESYETALHLAAKVNSLEIVQCLIENRADFKAKNSLGMTPLHYAVKAKSIGIVKYLLKLDLNVDEMDNFGMTPLHYAANENCFGIAKCLLAKNADVNRKEANQRGFTPLHIVAEKKGLTFAKFLMKEGHADTHVCDSDGLTANNYF